jgi:hypothetical protein
MTRTQRVWMSQRPTNGLRWSIQPSGGSVGDDLTGPPYLTSSMWFYSWFCSSLWYPAHEGWRCKPPTKPSRPPTGEMQ